jgi:hypothetical protein
MSAAHLADGGCRAMAMVLAMAGSVEAADKLPIFLTCAYTGNLGIYRNDKLISTESLQGETT